MCVFACVLSIVILNLYLTLYLIIAHHHKRQQDDKTSHENYLVHAGQWSNRRDKKHHGPCPFVTYSFSPWSSFRPRFRSCLVSSSTAFSFRLFPFSPSSYPSIWRCRVLFFSPLLAVFRLTFRGFFSFSSLAGRHPIRLLVLSVSCHRKIEGRPTPKHSLGTKKLAKTESPPASCLLHPLSFCRSSLLPLRLLHHGCICWLV